MAFSQVSLTYFFQDLWFDVAGIASGWNGSRWTDAQTTTPEFPVPFPGSTATGTFSYQPLGAANPYTYEFTLTSQSGFYKFGSHPDLNLNASMASGLQCWWWMRTLLASMTRYMSTWTMTFLQG